MNVKIKTLSSTTARILMDGIDISNNVQKADVKLCAGCIPVIECTLVPDKVEIDGEYEFIQKNWSEFELNINNLERCILVASELNKKYIAVKVQMKGFLKPEIIINCTKNFRSKLDYYKKAYNEDLTLKTFNGIKIIGFTYGDSFEDIENDLIEI